MASLQAFHGTVVHSTSPSDLAILQDALVVVDGRGRITALEANVARDQIASRLAYLSSSSSSSCPVTTLSHGQLLMPGFVDTHHHAPQWLHRGQGQGLHILEWLDQVAFRHEARFEDDAHARHVYADVVAGTLRQGITTASYYGSKHGSATKILADTCLARGQRALVGKCNMSRNAPDSYRDQDDDESLAVTRDVVAHIRRLDPTGSLVRPVLTPRFAICCGPRLLSGLGDMAAASEAEAREAKGDSKGDNGGYPALPIQTHFNESEQERDATLALFPEFANEADLYRHFGLLTPRTILAHCTVMTEADTAALAELRCGVAHCPTANMTVGGGFMAAPVKHFLRRGIKVGLGTDSGGGYSSSMLDAMRHSLVASFARDYLDSSTTTTSSSDSDSSSDSSAALSLDHVFHMATLGGAQVVGFADQVGTLVPGKQFDALLVDLTPARGGINAPLEHDDSSRTVLEKFVMTGDDRNIAAVYVRGVKVHGATSLPVSV